MAEGGHDDMMAAFTQWCDKPNGTMTTRGMTKWCKDCAVFGKACTSNSMDIAFSKCKTKGQTTINGAQCHALIKEMSKDYAKDKKMDQAAAEADMCKKLCSKNKKFEGTKQAKNADTERMTDTSAYTGAHKERFDAEGKGKGKGGRVDQTSNTGYVGNYKGEGSYGKK